MTEPTASATVAVGAPVASAIVMAVDVTLWPFGVAFFFAVITLGAYNDVGMTPRKSFWNVIASTSLGGVLSQFSAAPILLFITSYAPSIKPWADLAQIPMTLLIAMAIGLTAHRFMPKILELIGGYRSNKT